jgi:hypothetical protein
LSRLLGQLDRQDLENLARPFRLSHLVALEGLLERLALGDLARLFRPSRLAVLVALGTCFALRTVWSLLADTLWPLRACFSLRALQSGRSGRALLADTLRPGIP